MELLYQDQSRLQSVASEYSHVSIAESDVKGLSNVQTLSIGEWPASASVLRRESRSCLSILTDLGVVVTTLPFFALAFAVFRAKDKEVDQNIWNIFQNTIKVVSERNKIALSSLTVVLGCFSFSHSVRGDSGSSRHQSRCLEA